MLYFCASIYELGIGINYNAAPEGQPPVWEKTDSTIRRSSHAGFDYMVETGPAKVYFAPYGSTYLMEYEQDGIRVKTKVIGLAYYDPGSGRKESVCAKAATVVPVVDGNKIAYPEIFPGMDLEFVYHPSGLHQNLIVKRREALPPLPPGMSSSGSYLMLETSLDLPAEQTARMVRFDARMGPQEYLGSKSVAERASLQAVSGDPEPTSPEPQRLEGEALSIAFHGTKDRPAFRMAEGVAWDARGENDNSRPIYRVLYQEQDKDFCLEGVRHKYLASASTEYPVVIDPAFSGTITGDFVWERGNTYYVSGPYFIEGTLIIEPGAIIKLDGEESGARIIASNGGKIIAKGTSSDPILITSADDDEIGEEQTPVYPGVYGYAFGVSENADPDCRFEYCKFRNGLGAILVVNISLGYPIQHNYFDNLQHATLYLQSYGVIDTMTNTVFNNLFDVGHMGIRIETHSLNTAERIRANIYHNTFVDGHTGLDLDSEEGQPIALDMQNNLFAFLTSDHGPVNLPFTPELAKFNESAGSGNNAFYANYLSPPPALPDNIKLEENPFYSNYDPRIGGSEPDLSGKYRVDPSKLGPLQQSQNRLSSLYQNELLSQTSDSPIPLNRDNIGDYLPNGLSPQPRTSGTPGCAWDTPDYIIEGPIRLDGDLVIHPGTVVAFSPDAGIEVPGGIKVTCLGGAKQEIVFDFFTPPDSSGESSDGYCGFNFTKGSQEADIQFQYCRFRNAGCAVTVDNSEVSGDIEFESCVFEDCFLAILIANSGGAIPKITNCIFSRNEYTFYISGPPHGPGHIVLSDMRRFRIENCVFYENANVYTLENAGFTLSSDTAYLRVMSNNIFVRNDVVGWVGEPGLVPLFVNNIVWNNNDSFKDKPDYFFDCMENVMDVNPLFVNRYHEADAIECFHDGFYLAQELGDVSHRLLRMKDLIPKEDGDGIVGPTEKLNIVIYGSPEPVWYCDLKGHITDGIYHDNNDSGAQTNDTDPILLQISLRDSVNVAVLPRNEKVTLHMAIGSSIDVFLPALEYDRSQGITEYKFWIAEDGSTYWASDAMDNHDGTSVTQSGSFATRYDTNALACGAFNARIERMGSQFAARSPAIDAGSDDAYGYDSTSTNPKVIDLGQPDIGYHYYRRVADDDPIMNPENLSEPNPNREIRISFREPGDPAIQLYTVERPPEGTETQPEKLMDFLPSQAVKGVIEGDIATNNLSEPTLTRKGTYDLRAFSKSAGGISEKVSFSLIVDPDPPVVVVE